MKPTASGEPDNEPPPRRRTLLVVTVSILTVLVTTYVIAYLAVSGDPGDDTSLGAPPTPGTPPAASPTPSLTPGTPDETNDLQAFLERCARLSSEQFDADVSYNERPTMTVNQPEPFDLTITPPGTVPRGPAGTFSQQDTVVVTCQIEAKLTFDATDVRLPGTQQDFRNLSYQPPDPAEWTWLVTPLVLGEIDGLIEVQPIIQKTTEGGNVTRTQHPIKGTYKFTIISEGNWLDHLREWTSSVEVVAGFLGAVAGILVLIRIPKWAPRLKAWWRHRREKPESDTRYDGRYM